MNKTLVAIACLLIGAGFTGLFPGCAPPPERWDTDQIRQRSDEGFKELQKEEDRRK